MTFKVYFVTVNEGMQRVRRPFSIETSCGAPSWRRASTQPLSRWRQRTIFDVNRNFRRM